MEIKKINDMENEKNSKKYIFNTLIYIACAIFVFFYPTSINGEILKSSNYVITYYLISTIIAVLYSINGKFNLFSLKSFMGILLYMCLATSIAHVVLDGEVSIARIVYVMTPAIIFSFSKERIISFKISLIINEIITIIILLWNICIMLDIWIIPEVTINYYSQFNWFTTIVFVNKRSPIFTFGIYSYGALFYALLFLYWIHIIDVLRVDHAHVKRYYIYSISFILFQFLMNGSVSILLGLIMLLILFNTLRKSKIGFFVMPFLFVILSIFMYLQDYNWSRIFIGTSTNGFASRYLSTLFLNNLNVIKATIFGIGFTIIPNQDILYTDSGYLVLFTMGNIFLPIYLYSSMYKFLKKSLDKTSFKRTIVIIFLFEIALPGLLYTKEIIFLIYYLMSMNVADNKYSGQCIY